MQALVTPQQRQAAKREIVRQIEQGASTSEARVQSLVPMHRTTVYRLFKRMQREGERAFLEGRLEGPGQGSTLEDAHVTFIPEWEKPLKAVQYCTTTISAQVTQDVLLLAGAGDHYVPVSQFSEQIATLKNVRSLTARLFTSYEQAQNHCQVGNFGLALRTVIEWIDSLRTRDEDLPAQR